LCDRLRVARVAKCGGDDVAREVEVDSECVSELDGTLCHKTIVFGESSYLEHHTTEAARVFGQPLGGRWGFDRVPARECSQRWAIFDQLVLVGLQDGSRHRYIEFAFQLCAESGAHALGNAQNVLAKLGIDFAVLCEGIHFLPQLLEDFGRRRE
jgi:hypothetical protein